MKILISSRSFGVINSEPLEKLKEDGFEIITNPYDRKLTEDELIELTNNVVGIIAGTESITENVLKNASELKVISRYGVGVDNVDLDFAKKNGIEVLNTPNAPAKAVSELALSMILSLLRRIPESSNAMKEGKWMPQMGHSLHGKILGIVGLGRIGKELVKLVQPFEMEILAYEKYPDESFIDRYNIDIVSLEEILSKSDIISIHVPLIEETFNLIGTSELSIMKKGSILINTARGNVIDEVALINALKCGNIAGAALDVFDKEPYEGELLKLENVLLTPHIGTYTEETRMVMEFETVDNLIKALSKEALR
ncbi:phosphoglycerate dehydrogenase [Methanococcoides sp. SA1]|nr:phosphoglycerate dehydrogenase [Methanococcoides sp. SA1]